MKICLDCQTENPLNAGLCSECGMPLPPVLATRAEAAKIRKEIELHHQRRRMLAELRRGRAGEGPSASGMVYLFGDRFAPEEGYGEELTWRGVTVDRGHLANQLLETAFVQLASDDYLRMELAEYRYDRRDIGVVRLGEPRKPLHGLEAAIWESITDDPEENRVTKIIQRIIGRVMTGPHMYILRKAKEGLREQGYLATEMEKRRFLRFLPDKVHWFAEEELIAPHEGKVDEVKAMLASFEASDPGLYKQLVKSVKKGIHSMKMEDWAEGIDWDLQ